ncbi:MAG: hypothetical protein GXP40_06840 [Chloroflexi bacterium]|nr:hypothetical protein [Chloroflexota bacterium]
MPKTFYTERDIEDLARQGVRSLVVDDNAVLTDLAYEKARQLGLELVNKNDKPPAAPERPYIAGASPAAAAPAVRAGTTGAVPPRSSDLRKRVYDAVVARLGDSVDPKLLDTIIRRVLKSIDTN